MTNDASPAIEAARAACEPFNQACDLVDHYASRLSMAMGFLRYHANYERSELAAESLRDVEEVRDFLNMLSHHLTFRSHEESMRAIDEWWDRQREAER